MKLQECLWQGGVQAHFSGGNTIYILLVATKEMDNITQESRVIYMYKCDQLDCDKEYIGEFAWTFGERLKGTP